MADEEKDRNDNQANSHNQDKAVGASAGASYQGAQGQQNEGRNPQQNESANQGGGIQGTGQSQQNPGGFTGGEGNVRDQGKNPQTDQNKNVE